MEYPQITSFLENVPLNSQKLWRKFISSLSSSQVSDFAQLCPDLSVRQRGGGFQDTDGLGNVVADRVIDLKLAQKLHIKVAGDDKPFPAISYRNHTYTLFRTLSDWETAQKIGSRLRVGYVVTQTPKGWVVWVHEQEQA